MTSQRSQIPPSQAKETTLWKQLWAWLRPDARLMALLVIIMIVNVVLAVSGPLLLQETISLIEAQMDLTTIQETTLGLTALFALLLLLAVFTEIGKNLFIAVINPRFIHRLRTDAFRKITQHQVTFFDQVETGRVVSRITNDSNELLDSGRRFAEVFSQLIIFITVFTVMASFNLALTLAAIAVTPILFISVFLMRKFQRSIAKRWRSRLASVNARFGEIMGSIIISKSFGREQENLKQFHELNEATYRAAKLRGIAIFSIGPVQDFLRTFGTVVLLFLAAWLISTNQTSVATIYLFILLQTYLFDPINAIARSYNQFQSSFAALERILEIMADSQTSEDLGGDLFADIIEGAITLQNVDFEYLPNTPVLTNVSFTVTPGETIAIVGHTGAGKSTVASLLMRFYTHKQGKILIDNNPITEYNLRSLRKAIGFVSHDVLLFSGTIRDNLKLAKLNATETEMWQALDQVQATPFIQTLPNALDTHIQEGGKNLSQGQRQMLSLARALLTNPRILILDEFTASLDLYTEAKIQEGIQTLLKSRTSIVIAHRL
ncbi:MAG: ABC transporter ATP-binding protein, partial [Candidatus Heimdallarchaeota archaeon]